MSSQLQQSSQTTCSYDSDATVAPEQEEEWGEASLRGLSTRGNEEDKMEESCEPVESDMCSSPSILHNEPVRMRGTPVKKSENRIM